MYDRELLALILLLPKWSDYLLSNYLIVRTDQKALKYLFDQNIHTEFQVVDIYKLIAFDFSIQYKKGHGNKAADAFPGIKRLSY